MNKEITISESLELTYGTRDDIKEVTDRLMAMHPEAKKIGVEGMRNVAQLAIMMGANPLPTSGEIYCWVNNGRTQIDLGIAYYRRKASEKDAVIWVEGYEPRPMTTQERHTYGVSEDDLASICRGYLLSEYEKLLSLGVPWQQAGKQLARTSTAIVEYKDMYYTKDTKWAKKGDSISPPHGRTWQWVSDKRAEKGFYRMKALVDTTLTDAIEANARQVIRSVERERWVNNPMSDEAIEAITEKSDNELNNMLFGDSVIEGEVVEELTDEEKQKYVDAAFASRSFTDLRDNLVRAGLFESNYEAKGSIEKHLKPLTEFDFRKEEDVAVIVNYALIRQGEKEQD